MSFLLSIALFYANGFQANCRVTKSSFPHIWNMASSSYAMHASFNQVYRSSLCLPNLQNPSQRCLTASRARTSPANTSTTARERRYILWLTMPIKHMPLPCPRQASPRREYRTSSQETAKISRKSTPTFSQNYRPGSRTVRRVLSWIVRPWPGMWRKRRCYHSSS